MQTLKEYIESEIIPRYDNFDGAHRRDHVRSVIGQSQELSKYYDVNPEILYAAAAYHDLGLCEGREKHHLVSGRIIREDKTLLNWFNVEEIEVIAEAAEDHRASNETPPRSIYGKIIAESDRLIDPETVIRRTVQYGFAHYPQMNREQMWERTLTHLQKKYGYGGYLKLWIPESSNACRLEELRKIIADEKRLRSMFDRFYDEGSPDLMVYPEGDTVRKVKHSSVTIANPLSALRGTEYFSPARTFRTAWVVTIRPS